MLTAIVVGNPKPRSRTFEAAALLVEALTGGPPDRSIDLADIGAHLLGWGDPVAAEAVASVSACDLVVFASPTFKATYSGLIKLFLDQFPQDGLAGTIAVPLMLGAAPHHALAPDLLLKPVLVELGAICPLPGIYLGEKDYAAPGKMDRGVELWRRANGPRLMKVA